MLIWAGTVVSMAVAATVTVTHRRRHQRTSAQRRLHIAFYLDDARVMDLYLQGPYKTALRQEVEEWIGNNREAVVKAGLAPVQARGRRAVNREVFRRYIEQAEPITVVGIIIDVLDKASDIVDVNLLERTVTSNHALNDTALVDAAGDDRPTAVRLRDVDAFVSVRGRFRLIEEAESSATFQAPYGDPANPNDGPQVRVTCARSGLRSSTLPEGSFPARCLGRVRDWDPQSRHLVLDPIAIFN